MHFPVLCSLRGLRRLKCHVYYTVNILNMVYCPWQCDEVIILALPPLQPTLYTHTHTHTHPNFERSKLILLIRACLARTSQRTHLLRC